MKEQNTQHVQEIFENLGYKTFSSKTHSKIPGYECLGISLMYSDPFSVATKIVGQIIAQGISLEELTKTETVTLQANNGIWYIIFPLVKFNIIK